MSADEIFSLSFSVVSCVFTLFTPIKLPFSSTVCVNMLPDFSAFLNESDQFFEMIQVSCQLNAS
jgi:hypothetical protein